MDVGQLSRCQLSASGLAEAWQRPPPHLTPAEAAIWIAAERAKHLGDRKTYWRMRRALLLCQASRYEVEQP